MLRGEGPRDGHPLSAMSTPSSLAPQGFSRPGTTCKAPLAASPGDLPGLWRVRGQVALPQLCQHHPPLLPAASCTLPAPSWPWHPAPTGGGYEGLILPAGVAAAWVMGTWVPPGATRQKNGPKKMMLGLDPVQTPQADGWLVAWGQLGDNPSVRCSISVSLDGDSVVAPGTLDVAAGGPGCSVGSWDEGAARGGVWPGRFAAGWPRGCIWPPPSHVVSTRSVWPHRCRGRPPQPRCADGLVQDVGLPERDTVHACTAAHGDEATGATSHSHGDLP